MPLSAPPELTGLYGGPPTLKNMGAGAWGPCGWVWTRGRMGAWPAKGNEQPGIKGCQGSGEVANPPDVCGRTRLRVVASGGGTPA